jgi:hypothetical protein
LFDAGAAAGGADFGSAIQNKNLFDEKIFSHENSPS